MFVDWEFKKNGHNCEMEGGWSLRGHAFGDCLEDTEGRFWISNGEYSSEVNFCPVCGERSKRNEKRN